MIRAITVFLLISLTLASSNLHGQEKKIDVIIDADTGNEVDDLFAIVRALIAPELNVLALNSAQWQNSHWSVPNTLENSHRLNVRILSYLKMGSIPHPRGAQARLYDWGQDVAQHSAAAYNIINEAKKANPQDKLTVVALGALTNVASALLIDPSIAKNMRLYCLGSSYNFEKQVWKKTDFNCLMDPHAINVVMDNPDLEMHITPVNVAADMKMTRLDVIETFYGKDDIRGFLYDRWLTHMDGGYQDRVIWDLVPFYYLLNSEWIEEEEVSTPPENTSRKIYVTSSFNSAEIKRDFFDAINQFLE